MGKAGFRPYLVCKCGGWIYQDRAAKWPQCTTCGAWWKLPKEPRPHNQSPVAQPAPLPHRRARSRGRQVRFQEPESPPGLPSTKTQPARVDGKGARTSLSGAQSDADPVVVKKLFEGASPETVAMLKAVGLSEPAPQQPSLNELCQQHIMSLPAEIQEALAEPVVEPSQAQQVLQENRRFKEATGELRTLIAGQVDLQTKITKAKASYASLLAEMQSHMHLLETKQAEVQALQQKLRAQTQVQENPADQVSSLLEALQRAGVALDPDQQDKIRAELAHSAPAATQPPGALADPPEPTVDTQMPPPLQAQEAKDNAAHQQAIISALQEELRQARGEIRQLKEPASSESEPASKKPKSGDSEAASGASRSRSPKNRGKATEEGDPKV